MKKEMMYRMFLFFLGTMLFVACSSDDDSPDEEVATGSGELSNLANLKAAFDRGDFTHVDYITVANRVLLDETIISMEVMPSNNLFDFELMEIVTSAADNQFEEHVTTLTFSDESRPRDVRNGVETSSLWAETIVSVDGGDVNGFTPFAFLEDSEITTRTLNGSRDKLQIRFKTL